LQVIRRGRAQEGHHDPEFRIARRAEAFNMAGTLLSTSLEGGGAEGDLMRLMGWSDRSMLDRYGADLAVHRAIQAKRRMGEMY
jgi:hypothetical protein